MLFFISDNISMPTLCVCVLDIHTSRWLVASYGSNADVSQISHVQCPIRRHHQRRRTIKPCVFGVAVSCLIAVTVGIVLQDRGRQRVSGGEQHYTSKWTSYVSRKEEMRCGHDKKSGEKCLLVHSWWADTACRHFTIVTYCTGIRFLILYVEFNPRDSLTASHSFWTWVCWADGQNSCITTISRWRRYTDMKEGAGWKTALLCVNSCICEAAVVCYLAVTVRQRSS